MAHRTPSVNSAPRRPLEAHATFREATACRAQVAPQGNTRRRPVPPRLTPSAAIARPVLLAVNTYLLNVHNKQIEFVLHVQHVDQASTTAGRVRAPTTPSAQTAPHPVPRDSICPACALAFKTASVWHAQRAATGNSPAPRVGPP